MRAGIETFIGPVREITRFSTLLRDGGTYISPEQVEEVRKWGIDYTESIGRRLQQHYAELALLRFDPVPAYEHISREAMSLRLTPVQGGVIYQSLMIESYIRGVTDMMVASKGRK